MFCIQARHCLILPFCVMNFSIGQFWTRSVGKEPFREEAQIVSEIAPTLQRWLEPKVIQKNLARYKLSLKREYERRTTSDIQKFYFQGDATSEESVEDFRKKAAIDTCMAQEDLSSEEFRASIGAGIKQLAGEWGISQEAADKRFHENIKQAIQAEVEQKQSLEAQRAKEWYEEAEDPGYLEATLPEEQPGYHASSRKDQADPDNDVSADPDNDVSESSAQRARSHCPKKSGNRQVYRKIDPSCHWFLGEIDLPLCCYRYRGAQFAGYVKARSYDDQCRDANIYGGIEFQNPILGWLPSGKYMDTWRQVVKSHVFLQAGMNLPELSIKAKGGIGLTFFDRLSIGYARSFYVSESHYGLNSAYHKFLLNGLISKSLGLNLTVVGGIEIPRDTIWSQAQLDAAAPLYQDRWQLICSTNQLSRVPFLGFLGKSVTVGVAFNILERWEFYDTKQGTLEGTPKGRPSFYCKLNVMALPAVSRYLKGPMRQAADEPMFALLF